MTSHRTPKQQQSFSLVFIVLVHVSNHQSDHPIDSKLVQKIAEAVILYENASCDEVAIHFISCKEMCQLHQRYFNDPSPTDCISFPIHNRPEEKHVVLGDIFICPATAIQYAATHPRTTVSREIILYIVHGFLHLIGYDDIQQIDRQMMRKAEKRQMQYLKKNNLLYI